jgi:tight adherence protein B
MDDQTVVMFVGAVFITVFLMSQVLIMPSMSSSKADRKRLKQRFEHALSGQGVSQQSIVKVRALDKLPIPIQKIERLPLMRTLSVLLEQSGKAGFAYEFVFIGLLITLVVSLFVWIAFHQILWTIIAAIFSIVVPIAWLMKQKTKYLDEFEEQLPEALEMMSRTLRIGYPFIQSLKIVSTEMEGPVSKEFALTYEELNYGRNVDTAFALMIDRVPSMSLSAMATAILIQKETGGNLSEVLLNISGVLRGRFKLQRTIKTLSAEGIFSAWVLCLIPFVMFLLFNLINPHHFDALYEHPDGYKLFYVIGFLEVVAIFWIRRIITIDV